MKTALDILIEKGILAECKGRLDFNLSRDGHVKSINDLLEAMHEYAQQFSESHISKPEPAKDFICKNYGVDMTKKLSDFESVTFNQSNPVYE